MRQILDRLLPQRADNDYKGHRIAAWFMLLYAMVGAVRSCIHLLAPDGGAGSIAGMNLAVTGASGIIFAFSLWGSAQLLYAVIQLVVYFRYRTLLPFMYVVILAEVLLRMFVGHIKPVQFAHTPPGAIGNWAMIPLALIMLVLSLKTAKSAD